MWAGPVRQTHIFKYKVTYADMCMTFYIFGDVRALGRRGLPAGVPDTISGSQARRGIHALSPHMMLRSCKVGS